MNAALIVVVVGAILVVAALTIMRKRDPASAATVQDGLHTIIADLTDKLHKSVPAVTRQPVTPIAPAAPVAAPVAPASGLPVSAPVQVAPVAPAPVMPAPLPFSPTGAYNPDGTPFQLLPNAEPTPERPPEAPIAVTLSKDQRDEILRNFDASIAAGRIDLAYYQITGREEGALRQRSTAGDPGVPTQGQISYYINLWNAYQAKVEGSRPH